MRVDSLFRREGLDPVERTGPIPLPGRRPRHAAPRGTPAQPPPDDTDTRPLVVGGAAFAVPSGAFPVPEAVRTSAAVVPRTRVPRPTPPTGIPAPTLARTRPARPDAPRHPEDTVSHAAPAVPPRSRSSRRLLVIALVVLVVVLCAAGLAVAAWLFSGSGGPG